MTTEQETAPDLSAKGSKKPGENRRPPVTFRCRPALHGRLQEAATAAGRSLSEEIERRLDQSFLVSDVAQAAAQASTEAKEARDRERVDAAWTHFSVLVGGRRRMHETIEFGMFLTRIHHVADRLMPDLNWFEGEKLEWVVAKFAERSPRLLRDLARVAKEEHEDLQGLDAGI